MEILITSVLAFISTNIDDIFLLTLFYGNKKFKEKEIVTGQLLGISALILISLIGSLVGLFIEQVYIGLLGLAPIYIGVKGLWKLLKNINEDSTDAQETTSAKSNVLSIATVTIANGGDNIGIYIPLFATLTWPDKSFMITVFLILTFVWCFIAKYFTKHPLVAKAVDKYGHQVTPFVLILLGLYILYENGTFGLLAR